MKDFARRGGKIEYPPHRGRRYRAAGRTGSICWWSPPARAPLGELFAYRPEHSPYSQPQRRLCVGLYTGVRQPDPMNVTLSVSPGHGEMIVIPTITFDGIANALLMENVPGGDMEELATLSYEAGPASISCRPCWSKLEKHHPTTYDRIDTATLRSGAAAGPAAGRRGADGAQHGGANSTAANAPSRSATCIRWSIR